MRNLLSWETIEQVEPLTDHWTVTVTCSPNESPWSVQGCYQKGPSNTRDDPSLHRVLHWQYPHVLITKNPSPE